MDFAFDSKWVPDQNELYYMAASYAAGFILLKLVRSNKQPLKLKFLKLIYNALMSSFSFYVFYGIAVLLVSNYQKSKAAKNPLKCDELGEMFNGMEYYFKIFYYSKFVEYIDTIFLVMGGVANPSLKMGLHLYHHLITPTIVFVTWFYPCTGGWVGPLSNSFVHVVMYAYYGISVVYPGIKKYGNVVTYVQLTQFISVILYHVIWILPNVGRCINCNKYQLFFNFAQYVIFLALFFFFLSIKNLTKTKAKGDNLTKTKAKANGSVKKE